MSVPETEKEVIAEFQRRRREFKPLWTRNIGLVFFPGFAIFVIGGQTDKLWLVIPGIAVCLVGAARGFVLILRYRRCPVCGMVQTPRVQLPYRICRGCGNRLSLGAKDST